MNYIDTNTFNSCCTEWDFYFTKIIGNGNLNSAKKQLIEYLLTPTYFNNNKVYFDYRASIINLLITTPLSKYRDVIPYILQMKEDENNYQFVDIVYKNDYSIYDLVFLISKLNRWDIDGQLLLNIQAKEYDTELLIFNKYDTLKQIDLYLNSTIADPLWGLYQRTYQIK